MRHFFLHKFCMPVCITRISGVLLVILLSFYPTPSFSDSQVNNGPEELYIDKIIPENTYSGGAIEIFLDRDLSKMESSSVQVIFDNVTGDIISSGSNVLKVRIPKELSEGQKIWAIVMTDELKSQPYRITVWSTPRIAGIYEFIHTYSLTIYVVFILAGLGIIIWIGLRLNRRRIKLNAVSEEPDVKLAFENDAIEPEPELKLLQPPDDLINACQKRECIVFIGPGLNRMAGLPDWHDVVQGLLQWAMDEKLLDEKLGLSYSNALKKGDTDLIADGVARAAQAYKGPKNMEVWLSKYLSDVFASKSPQPAKVHHLLKRIGIAGTLTTNFDFLLEKALEAPVFTLRDAEKLLPKLAEKKPFILKLYGTLDQPETIQVSPVQFRDTATDNRIFIDFIEKLFISRTFLFIGTSIDDIQSTLEALQLRRVNHSHYAIIPVSGSEWNARAVSLRNRWGVQILPCPASKFDAELLNFFEMLADRVTSRKHASAPETSEAPRLKRLRLINIGPFKNLELELDPQWNIFLGNNGVGKSNILKAIALALCGKAAQPFADRLLKYRKSSGEIDIELTDGKSNHIKLYRTNIGIDIKATTQRELLGTERWLAMAFPPLRQIGWIDPEHPQKKPGTPYTIPGDLIPLISGDPDPRMRDLKQIIIDMYSRSTEPGGEKYDKRLNDLYQVIRDVTKGVTLGDWHFDKDTWRITIDTDDDEVPLAAVSQGTQSIMGWICLMVERLYQVYDNIENPREGPGLIMIDEIDAHMHPFWQQIVVRTLSELFPNMQFIATTHSPLVVGGIPVRQVVRFERDEKGIVIKAQIDEDMT
ncbi:MAG: AAA family ATPase, partial [Desulfobacteraceae bacterium]